jgi:hypothetical protein
MGDPRDQHVRDLEGQIAALKAEVAKRTKTLLEILALQKDGEAEVARLKDLLDRVMALNILPDKDLPGGLHLGKLALDIRKALQARVS